MPFVIETIIYRVVTRPSIENMYNFIRQCVIYPLPPQYFVKSSLLLLKDCIACNKITEKSCVAMTSPYVRPFER
jgi:hypothetical protein